MKKLTSISILLFSMIGVPTVYAMDAQTEMQTSPDSSMVGTSDSTTTDNSSPMMTTQEATHPADQTPPAQNSGESALHKLGGKVQDATITTAITAKYAVDPLLGPFSISVTTTDGMVMLSGNVDSKTQYERAMTIASSTNGVKGVDAAHLMVTPSQSFASDAYMTSKIKAALLKAQYFANVSFNSWNLHVETNNGVVYLTGHVPDEMAKTQVMDVVKAVEGVNQVEADLQVM